MVNFDSADLDGIFSALADPTRRAIVARLAKGGASVGELAAPFEVSLPAISKHLKILEGVGLLARERHGRVHRLRLVPKPMSDAAEWIDRHRAFWERRFEALDRHLQRKEATSWPRVLPDPAVAPSSASSGNSRPRGRRSSARSRIRKS